MLLRNTDSVASVVRRLAAAGGGAITLVVCATFTFGTVLAAPLGVLLARALARRRQRRLTRGAAWLGAVLASFIAVPVVFGGMLAMSPPGTIDTARAVIDSAQAQRKPARVPAWLERISPPQTQRQTAMTEKMAGSRAFIAIFSIIGLVMAASFLGTIAGSIGWVASMLFGYTITGRWLPGGDALPVAAPMDD